MFSHNANYFLLPLVIGLLVASAASAADKTDVVVFSNGDRLTGEIKSLERGKLSFKTDTTDTIRIEWDDVAFLTTNQHLQIELETGQRYFGDLMPTRISGTLNVLEDQGNIELAIADVVTMAPIETVVRNRIDGDLSFGYNYTQASDVAQLSVGLNVSYRDERRILSADLETGSTTSANNEASHRADLAFTGVRLLRNRWVAGVLGSAERNDELGIDRRISVGGGGGRFLRQTNQSNFMLLGGLQVTQEKRADTGDTDEALEALGSLRAEWFRYDAPELDFSTRLDVYPNLSDLGRVRADLDLSLKWEIVSDLFWDITIYNSYDSDPPSADAEENDFGVRTSVGWDF